MIMMLLRNGWMGFCENNGTVRYDNSQKGVIFMKKIKEQVGNYLNYCEKVRGMSPATMWAKRNILKRFIEVTKIRNLEELDNSVFNEWVENEKRRGVSARSINTYNATICAMVQYYVGLGVGVPLKIPLVQKLKEGETRRRFYTAAEIGKVLEYADIETGLMIKIMFETGMRIAELTRMKVGDIDGRRIRFVGKGNKPREVYMREGTRRKLFKYLMKQGRVGCVWGDGVNGDPPTVETVRKRLRRPFYTAGFYDFYPHALRHSFATDLQMRGASVAEIKEMIGHENIATTERYLHGFEGRLEELFSKYR